MALKLKKTDKSIPVKIKKALDGRTQRWLALKISMADTEMSNKMNCITPFSIEDLIKIDSVLATDLASKI